MNAKAKVAADLFTSFSPVALASDPVSAFLARLERVRASGKGWTARCPAHEDRTSSLCVTAGDDGRVLLHCFAGCSSLEVVHAAGLELKDLFVRRVENALTFAERGKLREYARQSQWRAALNTFALEMKVVQIAAYETLAGKALSPDDCGRLAKACEIIDRAREVLCVQSS